MVFVIIALARPQAIEERVNHTQKGVDIMIVMDISLSMLIEDMGARKTRLESSREVVGDFIEGRPNDRIGLIVFSGESFTKVPLTFDHEILKSRVLRGLKHSPFDQIRNSYWSGFSQCNGHVLNSPRPDSRIIIFLTDGENNTGFIESRNSFANRS